MPAAAIAAGERPSVGNRWRTPEYVTRNDELLAGDARQSLMRNDSVKLDKRVMATPLNEKGGEGNIFRGGYQR